MAEWKRVAPILHRRGLLTDDTRATVENYCRATGLCRAYAEMMETEGHVIQTDKGPVSHPAFKMLMGAMREARLLAAELALTPHRKRDSDQAQEVAMAGIPIFSPDPALYADPTGRADRICRFVRRLKLWEGRFAG